MADQRPPAALDPLAEAAIQRYAASLRLVLDAVYKTNCLDEEHTTQLIAEVMRLCYAEALRGRRSRENEPGELRDR